MTPVRAVIFDLDGTLIDSERVVIDAGAQILQGMGFVDATAFLTRLVGIDAEEGRRRLSAHAGPDFDLAAFDGAWDRAARAALDENLPVMPGAGELIGRLAARRMPKAVATNSRTASALAKLDRAGLMAHFAASHVIGVDLVARAKPAPDLFLEAAARLAVAPSNCVVFEDSETGVAVALAAGMRVVQVPDIVPAQTADAHVVAGTLLEGARRIGLID